ncbi:MAG: vitamin B12-dependent ribonucleotide reductase [FCB group bacterium]|nr:vitamin B12-dependent ribonucleotide reductase [FCB group bacterium]
MDSASSIESGNGETGDLFLTVDLTENDIEIVSADPLEVREKKSRLPNISPNALTVLEKRYFLKDEKGGPQENAHEMFLRVARSIASAEAKYGGDPEAAAEVFYRMTASLDFIPNSPTLMNAGRELGQLSACFVLRGEDSMQKIFETIKNPALIHKSGGGTGFSFSRLRPKNAAVRSTAGTASGPVSFMSVFNAATETVKQGGTRRGANMAVLKREHPDIMSFFTCKNRGHQLTKFNISLALTHEIIEGFFAKRKNYIISPPTREKKKEMEMAELNPDDLTGAWRNGEPGIVFIDRINRDNPTPELGDIESTNPCGEQPLLPYESCNLGSINLNHIVSDGKINWDKLKKVVHDSVHFLDNVIDMNKFPLDKIRERTLLTRKIGLGVMGFADMLFQLKIPYDSEEGLGKAEEVMSFIREEGRQKSRELAEERGPYPAWKNGRSRLRNSTITTIAPTGTISMIADTSGGIEPNFALAYVKRVLEGTDLKYVNRHFESYTKSEGFYSKELIDKLAAGEPISSIENVPRRAKEIFKTAREIDASWHIRMQAAFQKYTDNAVSKTINFPNSATERDIREAFLLAYRLGCKGLTVYRDGSRSEQVYKSGKSKDQDKGAVDKAQPNPRIRPRVTLGYTERIKTGEGTLYITINEDSEGLCEVFASIGKHGGNTAAQSEAISRLISLALRCGIDAKSVIKQLKGISGPNPVWEDGQLILSTPDAIGKALERYITRGGDKGGNRDDLPKTLPIGGEKCPDCGDIVVKEEGCLICHSCGYSICG